MLNTRKLIANQRFAYQRVQILSYSQNLRENAILHFKLLSYRAGGAASEDWRGDCRTVREIAWALCLNTNQHRRVPNVIVKTHYVLLASAKYNPMREHPGAFVLGLVGGHVAGHSHVRATAKTSRNHGGKREQKNGEKISQYIRN